jgi:hypothetical protein
MKTGKECAAGGLPLAEGVRHVKRSKGLFSCWIRLLDQISGPPSAPYRLTFVCPSNPA